MMYIFQSLVKPILVYGNEVRSVNMNAMKPIDKVFLCAFCNEGQVKHE